MSDKKQDTAAERKAAQELSQSEQNRKADQAPPKDNVVKAPDTPVPNDRDNWNDDGITRDPVGVTNLDPLGTGTAAPTNAVADPTDTRAIGFQSGVGIRAPEVRKSPVEGKVPTASGSLVDPEQAPAGSVVGAPAAFFAGPVKMREPEMLEGETVQLTAPHYINDQLFDAGAVLEDYVGPLSNNMLVQGRDGFKRPSTAHERQEIRFRQKA